MAEKDKSEVDDLKLENAMLKLKNEIVEANKKNINESIDNLESRMTDIWTIRANYFDTSIKGLKEQSNQHYQEMKEHVKEDDKKHVEILATVDAKMETFREEIKGLDRRQSKDEGGAAAGEKHNAFDQNKKTIFWTAAGVIATILSMFGISRLP